MQISPDQLIDFALDNLKHKLAAAAAGRVPIPPAALQKLPGAVREVVDILRGRGIRSVGGEDILAYVREDLNSRLVGSLKAGALLPNEVTPEIVRWLTGTPLAVPVANMIQPASRAQKAGAAAAAGAAVPIAILAKTPEGSGTVGIITRPPGESGPVGIIAEPPEDNGPVGIIVRPPDDNGPVGVVAKPPGINGMYENITEFMGDETAIYDLSKPQEPISGLSGAGGPSPLAMAGGTGETATAGPIEVVPPPRSEGASGKNGARGRWIFAGAGSMAILLILLGVVHGLRGSSLVGNAATTESQVESPLPATSTGSAMASVSFIPTVPSTGRSNPTATLSPTPSDSATPTLTETPTFFFVVRVDPKQVFYRGENCGAKKTRIQVRVADPKRTAGVWLLVRLRDKNGSGVTPWGEPYVMIPEGSGWYAYTLPAEDIPDFAKFREAWVQYQFVAYDAGFMRIAASEVYWDLELLPCGR
jgi:hypothetical protein